MIETSQFLAAYDEHLRGVAEMSGASWREVRGGVHLGIFGLPGEERSGFISYPPLATDGGAQDAQSAARTIVDVATAFRSEHPDLGEIEVKTRSHDHLPGLDSLLQAAGWEPEEAESVMVGPAEGLAAAPAEVDGVRIFPALTEQEMLAAATMEDEVFGSDYAPRIVPELMRRRAAGEPVTLWAAEVGGRIVSAGRIDPVAGTPFAGVWGGATLPEYRGRGIYRALTSARVRSVLEHGVTLIHSDSTEDSRPILERSGLVKITETIPYVWQVSSGA